MDLKETILKLIKDNKTTNADLAERLGLKRASSLTNITGRGDCKVSALFNICNELGYDIVIKPRHGENKAERTIVITEMNVEDDKRGKFER